MIRIAVVIAGIAALTVGLANTTARANAPDTPAQGQSEAQIGQDAGASEVKSLMDRYGLKEAFTAADLRDAASNYAVRDLMTNYNLSPDFTAEDYKRAAGAHEISLLLGEFPKLSPQFTVQQLAEQQALEEPVFFAKDLKVPFSYDEYVRSAALSSVHDFSGLPSTFVYTDLVRVLGPEAAASIRLANGFARDATHEEIMHSIGVGEAESFDRFHNLKEGFTAQDLLTSLTQSALDEIKNEYGLDAKATSAQYAAVAGEQALGRLLVSVNRGRKLISATFTEADYAAAAGENAVEDESEKYDLNPGFTESDIFKAAAASAQADERVFFGLAPGFSAQDDATARKAQSLQNATSISCH